MDNLNNLDLGTPQAVVCDLIGLELIDPMGADVGPALQRAYVAHVGLAPTARENIIRTLVSFYPSLAAGGVCCFDN